MTAQGYINKMEVYVGNKSEVYSKGFNKSLSILFYWYNG